MWNWWEWMSIPLPLYSGLCYPSSSVNPLLQITYEPMDIFFFSARAFFFFQPPTDWTNGKSWKTTPSACYGSCSVHSMCVCVRNSQLNLHTWNRWRGEGWACGTFLSPYWMSILPLHPCLTLQAASSHNRVCSLSFLIFVFYSYLFSRFSYRNLLHWMKKTSRTESLPPPLLCDAPLAFIHPSIYSAFPYNTSTISFFQLKNWMFPALPNKK